SLVDIENVEASRRAVEHLLALGHVRIAHLAGPEYSMHSRERIEGVHRAFAATPHALPPDAIVHAGAHLDDGYRAGLALFGGGTAARRPTAVTCYNDLVALGLLRALRELGLAVPRDVSVIGFDDLRLLDWLDAPLDSVHVPTAEMGRRATALLLGQLAAHAPADPMREILEGRLVLRGSSAPPADAASARVPATRRGR
nr:substrate-binding domain-containing protein [Gemmatimonadaceae bacterium]